MTMETAEHETEHDARMVRIENTKARLLHLPDQLHIVGENGKGRGGRVMSVGTAKSLQPGGNNVSAEEWERCRNHKVVREWLRLGWLKEGAPEDVASPEGPLAPLSLSGYGAATAIAMAEVEDDRAVLSRWLKDEQRPDVQTAIRRRMEARGTGKK